MKSYEVEPWFVSTDGVRAIRSKYAVDVDELSTVADDEVCAEALMWREAAMSRAKVRRVAPGCVLDLDEKTGYLLSPYRFSRDVLNSSTEVPALSFLLTCATCVRAPSGILFHFRHTASGDLAVDSMPNVWLIGRTHRLPPAWLLPEPAVVVQTHDDTQVWTPNADGSEMVLEDPTAKVCLIDGRAYALTRHEFSYDPYLADPELAPRIRGMYQLACSTCGAGRVSIGPQKLHRRLVALAGAGVERMTIQDFSRWIGSH